MKFIINPAGHKDFNVWDTLQYTLSDTAQTTLYYSLLGNDTV